MFEVDEFKICLEYEIKNGVLSIVGSIFEDGQAGDAGQCIETIEKIVAESNDKKIKNAFDRILPIWKTWHLNGMHTGTEKLKKRKKAVVKEVEKAGNSPAGFSVKKYDEAGPDDIIQTSRGFMTKKLFDLYNKTLAREVEKRIGKASMTEFYDWLNADKKTLDDLLSENPYFWRDDDSPIDEDSIDEGSIQRAIDRQVNNLQKIDIYDSLETEPIEKIIPARNGISSQDQLLIVFAICAAVVLSFISVSIFFVVVMVGFVAGGLAFISALK